MTELTERVDLGVLFLDDTIPDWRGRIDPETLSMDSMFTCVLGQVFEAQFNRDHSYSPFLLGRRYLGEWAEQRDIDAEDIAISAGFDAYLAQVADYAELEAEWKSRL